MFPAMHIDEELNEDGTVRKPGQDYYLKPMNCPMHDLIFRSRGRSYRELPLRMFEFGSVYRYEKSGVIHGLTRVRGMTQDDAHIYCTPEQMRDELDHGAELRPGAAQGLRTRRLLPRVVDQEPEEVRRQRRTVGRPRPTPCARSPRRPGLHLVPDPGGAAFYGPKISVQVTDALGRNWQMSTIQLDFNLPERFELEYTGSDGAKHRPVMIHRALFGSIERFFGVLTEHYAGAFPAWLSPGAGRRYPCCRRGVRGSPVRRRRRAEGRRHPRRGRHLATTGCRRRSATHTTQKVPFMLLAGERDVAAGAVSFRFRDGTQINGVPVDEAVRDRRRLGAPPRERLAHRRTGTAGRGGRQP